MIKFCKFTFSKVEVDNHWVNFAKFGEMLSSEIKWYQNFRDLDQKLNPEKVYQIGMDQSTSCCGVFIKDYENTEAYMMEIRKEKSQSVDEAIFGIEMFLHTLCEGCKISHLIYERPINTGSFRSSQALFQLEGMIRGLTIRYSEFKTARLDYIENSSWRSVVILDEVARNYGRKEASEISVHRIFQWTVHYGTSAGSDKDIFEAIGVLFGWFINSFDALGRPYVRGDRYYGNIGAFLIPDVSAEELCKEFQTVGLESSWAVQNPHKSTYENLACAVEKYKIVCVELNEKSAMLALSIESNITWLDPEKMTVVLVAANYVDSRLFEITGDTYHFIL